MFRRLDEEVNGGGVGILSFPKVLTILNINQAYTLV